MKATTSRGVLYMEFRHVSPIVTTGKMDQSTRTEPQFTNQGDAGTYCTIKENDRDGLIIAQAQSIIHPLDVHSFNKDKGRVVSLGKALKTLFPGRTQKEDRTIIWDAYHNRRSYVGRLADDPNAPWNVRANV